MSYSTQSFNTPLDIAVPTWLKPTPDEDATHFVTFTSTDEAHAVRILKPVEVYPPGSGAAAPVPDDYLTYLLGQADHGAQLTDRAEGTVDGHKATILTARTAQSLDGSLGCPETGMPAADCFGIQDDLVLRIAVIDTDSGPLLMWSRVNAEPAPAMDAEAAMFDQFLAGTSFR